MQIRKRLAAAEPDRADYQRDLSVSYNKLGDLQGALGQGEQALALYTQSLQIRKRLAAAEPDRADYQRDLSVSYNKLGDLQGALGQGEQALALYTQSLQIAQRLLELQPTSTVAAIDLAILLVQISHYDPDPAARRREGRTILVQLRNEDRLNAHGEQILAELDSPLLAQRRPTTTDPRSPRR